MKKTYKVLIVDDSPLVLTTLSGMIKHSDMNVNIDIECQYDFSTPIKTLATNINKYDLILADYEVPGINGVEFCSWLTEQNATVPVLVLTGFRLMKIERAFKDAYKNIIMYANKPFTREFLMNGIKTALGQPDKFKFSQGQSKKMTIK